jgi:hypothetical protein
MAYDADGNFYNPYSPGSYEYEMEESNRYQEPGTGGVVTVAQTPDILRVQQAAPPPGFNTFNQVTSIILSVATLAVPGLGEMIGAQILEGLGITTATAAVEAGVGAAALSAGSTAAQGGSFNDVLKNSATAGFSTGINIGMGGGVAGAATGSFVGSAIQGGSVDQVLTNALAAGAGAGVQGVLGPAAGTIVRDLIKTGEVSDRTLINAAAAEIGAFNKPGERKAPIVEGRPIAPPAAEETPPTSISLNLTGQEPAPVPAATLPPVTVTAPVIAPTVTDVDVMKQVAAQQPATALPPVTVTAKPEEQVAPTVTDVPEIRPDTTAGLPTPPTELAPVTVTAKREEEPAPVVTDIPEVRPDTTRGLPAPIPQLEPVTVTAKREEEVAPTVTELPPVTVTGQQEPERELEPVTVTARREYELEPVTITARREEEVAPTVTELEPVTIRAKRDEEIAPTVTDIPPAVTELEPVTVTAKREEEVAPTITDIVAKTMEPPPAPPPPPAPEVKAEEPKKEEPKKEPKKEAKKLYPTVTSVPPPKRPGRQPIITGASPARLLADALAAYRPAGAIEGEESGKERQNVWNEKSLRLKDALGL